MSIMLHFASYRDEHIAQIIAMIGELGTFITAGDKVHLESWNAIVFGEFKAAVF